MARSLPETVMRRLLRRVPQELRRLWRFLTVAVSDEPKPKYPIATPPWKE